MYKVEDLYNKHGKSLGLELIAGEKGIKRKISLPEAHRPGLSLAGLLKNRESKRIVIFGKAEIDFLSTLSASIRTERLKELLSEKTPAVILGRNLKPPQELLIHCQRLEIPLFKVAMPTMNLLSRLTVLLTEEFAPNLCAHGTLVEVFGVGILIQGESAVGKSEAALGLIERGHRLISDDIVRIQRKEAGYLEGCGTELSKHMMEVRGIGIINVAHLYGAVCVRDRKRVDLVVRLEVWNDAHFYDRAGLDEKTIEILDLKIPYHLLPVKPGRDVVLLLETIALNYSLKQMGYHSAREFNAKLVAQLVKKKGVRQA